MPAQTDDVLELDEMQHWLPRGWSFVRFRKNKRWVWLARCRRTRQIVAYAIGDRSETTCRLLLHWQTWKVGAHSRRVYEVMHSCAYKRGVLYTDFWSAYTEVLPEGQHRATGKGAGQTCHPNKASHRKI